MDHRTEYAIRHPERLEKAVYNHIRTLYPSILDCSQNSFLRVAQRFNWDIDLLEGYTRFFKTRLRRPYYEKNEIK